MRVLSHAQDVQPVTLLVDAGEKWEDLLLRLVPDIFNSTGNKLIKCKHETWILNLIS